MNIDTLMVVARIRDKGEEETEKEAHISRLRVYEIREKRAGEGGDDGGGSSDLTAPGGGGGGDGNRSDKISTVSLIGVYYNNEKGLQVKIRKTENNKLGEVIYLYASN